jgi:hypothetical protein
MYRGARGPQPGADGLACKDNLLTRGVEHGFGLFSA